MLRDAHDRYSEQMQAIGLRVNSSESAIFVPQWQADTDEHLQARPEVQQHLFHAAQAPVPSIPMQRGTAIPLARAGLPILGAPIGTSAYCTAQIRKTITSIQRDLDLLSTFDHRHQRRARAAALGLKRLASVARPAHPNPEQCLYGSARSLGPIAVSTALARPVSWPGAVSASMARPDPGPGAASPSRPPWLVTSPGPGATSATMASPVHTGP